MLSYNYCEHSKTVITVIMSRNWLVNMGLRVGILTGLRKLVEVEEKYIFSINKILFNKFTLNLLLTGIGRILVTEETHDLNDFSMTLRPGVRNVYEVPRGSASR